MSCRLIAGTAPPAGAYDADIIILALDRVEETIDAIHSARAQAGIRMHVSILDQGSTPANLARLATAVGHGCGLYAAACNLGVAGGRNWLTRLGHGRVIVALDNDATFATADTVARLVAALDAEPALAAVGCRIVADRTGADDLSSWGYPSALLRASGESFDTVTFVGAGHAIRRLAWDDAGGYDETLFFCWEEFDFSLRAIARGWRLRYRGDIVICHKVAAEQRVGWSGRRWFYFVRNRLYVQRKLAAPVLPRACGYLVKGVIGGMPGTSLRAIGAALRMPRTSPIPAMSPLARDYLHRNDRLHRGNWGRRLVREVFSAIAPAAGAGAPAGR